MQPTPPTMHHRWFTPPNFDYSFKHSFAWPHPPMVPPGASAAGAAETVAAEAAHAAAAGVVGGGGGGIPPRIHPGMYYGYGRGWGRWGRPRGIFMRRFFWFGAGALAATWWIRHKEHKQAKREQIEQFLSAAPNANGNSNANAYGSDPSPQQCQQGCGEHRWVRKGWSDWHERWHQRHPEFDWPRPNPPSSSPNSPRNGSTGPVGTATTATSSTTPTLAQSLTTLSSGQAAAATAGRGEPTSTPVHLSTVASPSPVHQTQKEESSTVGGELDMKQIQALAEKVWAEKRRQVVDEQEKASAKAREFAKDKLDKLSGALEALRASLDKDMSEGQTKSKPDVKLV